MVDLVVDVVQQYFLFPQILSLPLVLQILFLETHLVYFAVPQKFQLCLLELLHQ